MLVDFIGLFPFELHELGQIRTGHDVDGFANLVMDHHGQGALDEAVGLEDAVLEVFEFRNIVADLA